MRAGDARALEVACPTCRMPVGRWCRTRITDVATDIHLTRYDVRFPVFVPGSKK